MYVYVLVCVCVCVRGCVCACADWVCTLTMERKKGPPFSLHALSSTWLVGERLRPFASKLLQALMGSTFTVSEHAIVFVGVWLS